MLDFVSEALLMCPFTVAFLSRNLVTRAPGTTLRTYIIRVRDKVMLILIREAPGGGEVSEGNS